MAVRQSVHKHILKLSQELSAEIGDYFWIVTINKSGKNARKNVFRSIVLGKDDKLA